LYIFLKFIIIIITFYVFFFLFWIEYGSVMLLHVFSVCWLIMPFCYIQKKI